MSHASYIKNIVIFKIAKDLYMHSVRVINERTLKEHGMPIIYN